MLLCPEHNHTSPNSTSLRKIGFWPGILATIMCGIVSEIGFNNTCHTAVLLNGPKKTEQKMRSGGIMTTSFGNLE